MRSVIAWAGIVAIWWLAGAILWLNRRRTHKHRTVTHRALRLSGRAQLSSDIDDLTYADAMLSAAKICFGYLLALTLIVFGLWLVLGVFGNRD